MLVTIIKAAKHNDVTAIERALENGEDVNVQDAKGNTALHLATTYLSIDAMKLLLEAGADVNARGDIQATPLHEAAFNNNKVGAKMLLAAGADLNLKDTAEETPADSAKTSLFKYLEAVRNGKKLRPTAEETGLDLEKRQAALDALESLRLMKHKFTEMEAARKAQRRAALERGEGI